MKKTVLITGGSKGIGLATAEYLLKKQFAVVLVARNPADLDSARERLVDRGAPSADIQTCVLDIADANAINGLLPVLEAMPGGLFGLINNAANEVIKAVTEYSLSEMESMWRVNVLAPILLIQTCHPYLKKGGGSIMNIGSVSDQRYCAGYAYYGGSAYWDSITGPKVGADNSLAIVAVPEPASFGLLISCFAGLLLLRRRRKGVTV